MLGHDYLTSDAFLEFIEEIELCGSWRWGAKNQGCGRFVEKYRFNRQVLANVAVDGKKYQATYLI
jgi:hypothetical protein